MKKNMRKILSLVLAMVMILSLSVTAFAADGTTTTYTVSIYVQDAMRDADDNIVYATAYNTTPITVDVEAGSTLKAAINEACNTEGSLITSPVWNPSDSQYLTALSVDGTPYENQDSFTYDSPEVGKATYEGTSWMYFDGEPSDMPASSYTYSDVSLGNRVVNSDMTITLSYEFLTYIWTY